MIVNITGCDGTGKSTIANRLCEVYGSTCEYTHFDKPRDMEDGKQQYFGFLDKVQSNNKLYICDRFHEGEWVYAPLYRGYKADYLRELENKLIHLQNYLMVYVKANLNTIIERTRIRGEDFVKEEHFQQVLDLFDRFLGIQAMPFITIDTTTAPLEDSINKIKTSIKNLNTIWKSLKTCSSCSQCPNAVTPMALPRGNMEAKYMLIAQNPGGKGQGPEKYVTMCSAGPTTKFLVNVLKQAGIYNDCWFTNIVMCSTSDNKVSDIQAKNCISNLQLQIDLIKPEKIFTLGKIASEFVKSNFKDIEVISVPHPSFMVRSYPNDKYKIDEYTNLFRKG